jgi:hypothetical protein
MPSIDLSQYPTGTTLDVVCKDGEQRKAIIKAFGAGYDGSYPHQLEEVDGAYRDSLTDRGTVFTSGDASGDIVKILPSEVTGPRPVARGFNRSDMLPSTEHGSERYGKILWRDSRDNELILRDVGEPPSASFDQWFPLAQLDFQVQEISQSLKAHKEAAKAHKAQRSKGGPESFTRGYLSAKGVEFSSSDFSAAFN